MSPTTRIVVFNFWEYAAFLTTLFIFPLIGLQIEITMLIEISLPAPVDRLLQHHHKTTLLIGTPEGNEDIVIQTLEENILSNKPEVTNNIWQENLPKMETDIYIFDVERFIEL